MSDSDHSFSEMEMTVCVIECRELVLGGWMSDPTGPRRAVFQACLTHFLVCLNDLLQKLDRLGHRISFNADVPIQKGVADITDLISQARNAACHISSQKHLVDVNVKFTRSVFVGKPFTGNLVKTPNVVVPGLQYDDDITIQFGELRLLVYRNLIRALDEAQAVFEKAFPERKRILQSRFGKG